MSKAKTKTATKPKAKQPEKNPAIDDDTAALLAELDAEAVEASEAKAGDDDEEITIDMDAAYASQKSEVTIASTDEPDDETPVAQRSKGGSKKSPKQAKTKATDRAASTGTRKPRDLDRDALVSALGGKATVTTIESNVDSLAVKVQDKARNFMFAAAGQATLSTYTKVAVKILSAGDPVDAKKIADELRACKYTDGTARAQAQQMMKLLPAIGVAKMDGKTLVADTKSPAYEAAQKLL